MKTKKLRELGANLLEFTKTPGILRVIKPNEPIDKACGLHFECPRCKTQPADVQHGITLLFDLPHVPKLAQPHGHFPVSMHGLDDISLAGRVFSATECGWDGVVHDGHVGW